jgi:hypothetical protein
VWAKSNIETEDRTAVLSKQDTLMENKDEQDTEKNWEPSQEYVLYL